MKLRMILELLLLFTVLDSALPEYIRSTPRRRDSVVNLHIVKRPLLPFNITFLQSRQSYTTNSKIDYVIEESVTSFLQKEFGETYHSFYAMEMENLPSTVSLEWPRVRTNVSFAGNVIFVLSGLPEESELHCLQRKLLVDYYKPQFEDLVDFNETRGDLELDFIQFGNNIICPPIDHKDDDGFALDGDEDTNDGGTMAADIEISKSQPKGEVSINLKDFVLSWQFMCAVLGTVILPMFVCLGCVCRKSRKVQTQRLNVEKYKRDNCSTDSSATS